MASPALSRPYARAAAVGSLITRRTFNPAIDPASCKSVLGKDKKAHLCCLTLTIVEISWDGDNGILDTLPKKTLGGLLHFREDKPPDLRRREFLIAGLNPCISI